MTDDKKKAVVKEAIKTPRTEKWGSFAFNVAAGALAAAISWSAYGPYALVDVFGGARPEYGLTLTALATAVIVGLGGTRWLTNERDKALLKQAGDVTAEKPASDTKRALMEKADPKQASRIAVMDI